MDNPLDKSADIVAEVGWAIAGFLLAFVIWEAVVRFANLPDFILPGPGVVIREIIQYRALLWEHSLVTLNEILIGFALSIVIGFPIAIGIAFSRILERTLYPLLIVSQAVPKVAVAPLFLIWFGFGPTGNAFLALLVAVFPVIINSALGLTEINRDFVRLGRVMGGNPWRIFWKIRFQTALPSIFAGLKLSITFATIGAVVGELVAGQRGLGYLSQFAASQLQTTRTFACIAVLALLGVILFYAIVFIERLMVSWKPRETP
jgi:NitT/TauT family transport system permease protein